MGRRFGIIGSFEVMDLLKLERPDYRTIETPYGDVQALTGELDGTAVVSISRGEDGLAAHAINHRANVTALLHLGVTDVLATAMVGSLRPALRIGQLLALDQFLDFCRRPHTYYTDSRFRDFDFTFPFCRHIRAILVKAAADQGIDLSDSGCYVGVDGPRFETASEVRMYGQLGGDVIGMTIVPECTMARETGLCYAAVAGVVNAGAGMSTSSLAAANFLEPRRRQVSAILSLIPATAAALNMRPDGVCECAAGAGKLNAPQA
jgi:5'-methylthioadenosine phosphorylase